MAEPSRPADPPGLIGGAFSIDFETVLPGAAPPHTAYAARRQDQAGFMAIAVVRGQAAQARPLTALKGVVTPHLLYPAAHGPATMPDGSQGYFIICPAPPGPSLAASPRAWTEPELIETVLKPAALVLADLHAHNVTHRAIRADNIFQPAPRAPVTLGCAWASPPACHQPAWMEPPYSAVCLPAGRGAGTVADDVYALGALILALFTGGTPMAGETDDAILRRKLDLGSYAALVGHHRPPAALAELLRGMLADEPDHRTPPALLVNPAIARSRRVATRAASRAQRPIEIGPTQSTTARMLAYAVLQHPHDAVPALRNGAVDRWLRRILGDPVVAGRVEEAVRGRAMHPAPGDGMADALMLTRVVSTLDPGAPLIWRSMVLWPDGLGPALDHMLHQDPAQAEALTELVSAQIGMIWTELRGQQDDAVDRLETMGVRSWLSSSRGGGNAMRLSYSLNPLAPCESALTARAWVTRLDELLPALEAAAGGPRNGRPLADAAVAAFIAAHRDERLDSDLNRLASSVRLDDVLTQVRLLARLQAKLSGAPLPRLAAWVQDALSPSLAEYGSKARRERMAGQLTALSRAGDLPGLVALLDDGGERSVDRAALTAAQQRLVTIDAELARLASAGTVIEAKARRTGHDVSAGLALLTCAASACLRLLT